MVFVDTGAWFARYVPVDPDHNVKAWLDANLELFGIPGAQYEIVDMASKS